MQTPPPGNPMQHGAFPPPPGAQKPPGAPPSGVPSGPPGGMPGGPPGMMPGGPHSGPPGQMPPGFNGVPGTLPNGNVGGYSGAATPGAPAGPYGVQQQGAMPAAPSMHPGAPPQGPPANMPPGGARPPMPSNMPSMAPSAMPSAVHPGQPGAMPPAAHQQSMPPTGQSQVPHAGHHPQMQTMHNPPTNPTTNAFAPQQGNVAHQPPMPQHGNVAHQPHTPQHGNVAHQPHTPQHGVSQHQPHTPQHGASQHQPPTPQQYSMTHQPPMPQSHVPLQPPMPQSQVPQPQHGAASSRPAMPHVGPHVPPAPQHAQNTANAQSAPMLLPISGAPLDVSGLQPVLRPQASAMRPPTDSAFVRATLGKMPRSAAALAKTRIPLGIVVTPYPRGRPAVPLATGTILRCRRCRTYINPYVELSDGGARWRCNLCFMPNDFPAAYGGTDNAQRVELAAPVYEYSAPQEYMVRQPPPPVFLFLLDASHAAVAAGVLAAGARAVLAALDVLPTGADRTLVGVLTYDAALHYYALPPEEGAQPRMLVVPDLADERAPVPRDLLVDLASSRAALADLLERMPAIHAAAAGGPGAPLPAQSVGSALGPALAAAVRLIANTGGKVVLVHGSRPSVGDGAVGPAPGASASSSARPVALDDVRRVLGTPKESALLQPANSFFKALATECNRTQTAVDAFLFAPPPSAGGVVDAATVACVSRYSGGRVWHYAAGAQGVFERFAADLIGHVGDADLGLEAVLRVRATTGLSLGPYHGSFFLRSSDLLALPNVNAAHAYAANVAVDENVSAATAGFQAALLYTTLSGERRIRVINAAFPVSDDPRELAASADGPAAAALLLKMAADKVSGADSGSGRLEDARDALLNKLAEIASASRTLFGVGVGPHAMLPAGLQLLPLLVLGALKGTALRPGVLPDVRTAALAAAKTLSVEDAVDMLHPFMFAVHAMPDPSASEDEALPPALRLSSEALERHGIYVLQDGPDSHIWVGSQAHPQLLALLFGAPAAPADGIHVLQELENPWSRKLRAVIARLRARIAGGHWGAGRSAPHGAVRVVREDSAPEMRAVFLDRLVEDRAPGVDLPSYVAFASTVREKSS